MLIDLGGGLRPHPRADVVLDLHHPVNAPSQDLTRGRWFRYPPGDHESPVPLPIDAESVDELHASHFLEHVTKGEPLIHVMNEAWRILRPGGTFVFLLPLIGWSIASDVHRLIQRPEPWADLTHVSHWWFPQSLAYLQPTTNPAHVDYGFQPWQVGDYIDENEATMRIEHHRTEGPDLGAPYWSVRGGWEGVAMIRKPVL